METETEKNRGRFIDFELLPSEIITEILSRLPADSAVGCRLICKQWRSLIDDPSFVDTHTHQLISNPEKFGNDILPTSSSSFGFFLYAQQKTSSFSLRFVEFNDDEERLVPEFKLSKSITDHYFPSFYFGYRGTFMISSCNGLVFMGSTLPNDMFVCNPFTGECVNLRTSPRFDRNHKWWSGRGGDHMTFGFGYHLSTNKYKVVSIYHDQYYVKGQVSVYTLGSGVGWRSKGEIPYSFLGIDQPGLFVNGAIHWYIDDVGDKKIISFDLKDEEFRVVVPLPPPVPSPSPNYIDQLGMLEPSPSPNYIDQLGMLEGCLCVIRSDKLKCKYVPKDVWMLVVNQEDKFSWKKSFSIPWRSEITSLAEPYAVLKSGKILFRDGNGITTYEPKTEAFYTDGNNFHISNGISIIPYTKSFVSLNALGEKTAKCFGRVGLSLSNS